MELDMKNGGPAFPYLATNGGVSDVEIFGVTIPPNQQAEFSGMTLRDYFAGQALAGRMALPGRGDVEYDAKLAYRVADAMLAAREAKP